MRKLIKIISVGEDFVPTPTSLLSSLGSQARKVLVLNTEYGSPRFSPQAKGLPCNHFGLTTLSHISKRCAPLNRGVKNNYVNSIKYHVAVCVKNNPVNSIKYHAVVLVIQLFIYTCSNRYGNLNEKKND